MSRERIYQKAVRIQNLRNLFERGVFAVPELQREFVWNAGKVCDLLDSLYLHYPIGTILVWQTDGSNETQLRKNLHILPQYDPANGEVLFRCQSSRPTSSDRRSAATIGSLEPRSWPGCACHQLKRHSHPFRTRLLQPYAAEGERYFHYRTRIAGDFADKLVSVVDLLAIGWKRRITGHGKRVMKRLEQCRRRILQYPVFFVYCQTTSLEEVRETFIRINSQGMRVDAADRAFARASRLNMRSMVREVQSRFSNGFEQIARTTILQTMALALGHRDLGERGIDSMISRLESQPDDRARFERIWPKLREAFCSAADFLIELGVPNVDFLPSEPMFTTVSLFFYHCSGSRPTRSAKSLLKRWFWATAVGARYSGRGYRPNLLADATFAAELGSRGTARLALNVKVPLYTLRQTDYSRPGPLSNAFFCLLRSLRPQFLEDGTEIPLGEISSRRNRNDKHHIFPRGLLRGHDIGPEKFNSILNICFLAARENQSIGQRSPRHYFADVPRNSRVRNRALASQLIPSSPDSGIWNPNVREGFRTFVEQRTLSLVKAFEKEAGIRLFERR